MRDLRPLLAPTSIAIVGASSRLNTVAARPLENLQMMEYGGALYPINPTAQEIAGIRCYPNLEELPEVPELALLVLPAQHVLPTLESCAQRGVKAAIVISAGFAETGSEGAQAQVKIREVAQRSGMVICGPNSLGVLNFVDRIPMTFGSVADMKDWPGGRVSLVSQSGGLLVGLANRAFDAGVNINYAVATGNEADLKLSETIHYLAEDPGTDVIVVIIEAIRNGPRFLSVCDRLLELGKPLIAYKLARSEKGKAAAQSHTGALAGSYPVLQAVFRQRGVIEAGDLDDLFALAGACAAGRFPTGPGFGVITESGGAGAITADRADDLGLTTATIGKDTAERLKEFVPQFAPEQVTNPFDVTSIIAQNPASVGSMAEAFFDDPAVGGLMVITAGSGEPGKARMQALLDPIQASKKPAFGVVLAGSSATPSYQLLRSNNIPAFHSPGKAVESMAALWHFARARERHKARCQSQEKTAASAANVKEALAGIGSAPTEYDAKRFLKQCGLLVVEERLAQSADQAVDHAKTLGYPVALKVQSPDIIHKTEVGGIRLNLDNAQAIETAYEEIMTGAKKAVPQANIAGMLVSRMVSTPLEFVAGIQVDPTFGPLILFGLGGIWVEVFDEAAMCPAPLIPDDVLEMVNQLRGAALLKGARNMPAVRPEEIQKLLLTLSEIALASQGLLSGIDINPLVPTEDGRLMALDASLFLSRDNS
ncbi:MAG: CoA-binding protein [Acidobacteria bacterium]|nr:MAG: CoA-binding protein [Acidobacteriota bacterium]